MTLGLTKMTGAGNDFLIFDARDRKNYDHLQKVIGDRGRAESARALCDRRFGVGADGFVILEQSPSGPPVNFKWDFYNADGSSAEMCGNAARCVGKYVFDHGHKEDIVNFETLAGLVHATKFQDNKNIILVDMPVIGETNWTQTLDWDGQPENYDFVHSGVPHAVLKVGSVEKSEWSQLRPLGSFIRNHDSFKPQGTNVTFIAPLDKNSVRAVSFERGVEDFTLACGTGAVAAAKSYAHRIALEGAVPPETIHVHVPGGELTINFGKDRPQMAGPAHTLAEIQVDFGQLLVAFQSANS